MKSKEDRDNETKKRQVLFRRVRRIVGISPIMAAIQNIKTGNLIKGLVSKKRRRYTQDGFNLDLTYIGKNIIAMGFPAERLEGVYRNHIDDVVKFLDLKHSGNYKIYNLCSERSYDNNRFHLVAAYPFADHNPPNIELIGSFCDDAHKWLTENENNVAAVHCKAGKGRTGTMICCYMLYSGQFKTPSEALFYYGDKRTHDMKGVTIPSQIRYVDYFSRLLKSNKKYEKVKYQIRQIKLGLPQFLCGSQGGTVTYNISNADAVVIDKNTIQIAPMSHNPIEIDLHDCTPFDGDIKFKFRFKNIIKKTKFHFWINTFFVEEVSELNNQGEYVYTLNKAELDNAHKDRQHKIYNESYNVKLYLQKQTDNAQYFYPVNNHNNIQSYVPIEVGAGDGLLDWNISGSSNINHNQQNNSTYNFQTNHLNNEESHINHNHHNNANVNSNFDTPSESSETSNSESSAEDDGWESESLVRYRLLSETDIGNFNNITPLVATVANSAAIITTTASSSTSSMTPSSTASSPQPPLTAATQASSDNNNTILN